MKDIILKSGTYLKDTKSTQTSSIPGQSLENFVVGVLANPTCCAKYVNLTKGAVTQTTSRSTAVTLNAPSGVITSDASSLATLTSAVFTVNTTFAKADSVILVTSNTTGSSVYNIHYSVESIANGSFAIRVYNPNGTAFTSSLKFNFVIL